MRLGVLDVGSNTVHLLVVDAHPGSHRSPSRPMTALGIERVDICPGAMREGIVLRRLDWLQEEEQLTR